MKGVAPPPRQANDPTAFRWLLARYGALASACDWPRQGEDSFFGPYEIGSRAVITVLATPAFQWHCAGRQRQSERRKR